MPAVSKVDICNRALQKLGAKRISAIDEASVPARACNLAYDIVRRSELRKNVWGFSIKRAQLAADSPAPTWGRQNSFSLPSDYLLLAQGYPELLSQDANVIGYTVAFTAAFSGEKDWVIEGQKIVTNDAAPLNVRYVYDVTDTTLFDAIFTESFATALGFEMCEELTQSNTKKAALGEAYKSLIDLARRQNSIEVAPADPPPDTWLTCRS